MLSLMGKRDFEVSVKGWFRMLMFLEGMNRSYNLVEPDKTTHPCVQRSFIKFIEGKFNIHYNELY